MPDAAGEVAFEAADGFAGGLAFGAFAGDVVAGFGVAAGAGDGDAVDGGVDLAVAAAVEAVAVGVAGADRDRGQAGGAGELGVGGEAVGAGDLADELGRGQWPEAGLGEQLRRDLGDEGGDLGLERLDRLGEFAQAAQLVAGDPDAHRLLGPGEPPADPRRSTCREQRAARQRELGPEIVQMPLQRVVEPDALADEPLAVIDQQPEVELGAVQRAPRQRLEPSASAARATAIASMRSDLPRSRAERRDVAISLVGTRNDALAAADQEPLQASPRRAGSPQAPRPARRPGRAPRAAAPRSRERRPGPSSRPAARPSPHRPRRSCASACACPHRARSSTRPLSPRLEADTRRTRLAGGGATLLSSHAGHPRPATSDTTKGSQASPGRQPQRESARRRSGPSPRRRTSPTPESQQQASKEQRRRPSRSGLSHS